MTFQLPKLALFLNKFVKKAFSSRDRYSQIDRKKFVSAFLAETPHHHEVPSESSSKPHHGVASSKEPETNTVGGFSFEDGKHAMFSYQWDSQAEVIAVREYFASLGIPTWMVSGSTVLVAVICYILVCWLH